MRILLLEDEPSLSRFMEKGLQQAGYAVTPLQDGAKGLEAAVREDFDLVILDLMLPGMNGFDILANLRSLKVFTPVLIVSALSDTGQVVKGLDLGAVDYIRKPFDWDELLARIRVIRKKSNESFSAVVTIHDLVIDSVARKVSRGGKDIRLTSKEFLLLDYLVSNTNRIVSKNQIMENVWDMHFDPGSNIVEAHIYQLRKKIDKDFEQPLIETVVGMGYSLKGEKTK